MKTLRTVEELRAALVPDRRQGLTIGLVPTMGALHEGHLSLIERAREQCDRVVVSLFVNPAQFNERSDLERYPRQEADDARLAARAGADLLFPPGFATSVEVLGITERLEGAARGPEHFRGVCTVVTKLLCMCQPDIAYFGHKDAQQVAVICRLVRDLNLPVRIETCPTVREPDGLAMSSRNALLSPDAHERALALPAALRAAAELTDAGERSVEVLLQAASDALARLDVEPEYLAIVDPDTFTPRDLLDRLDRPALLVLAARVGDVRLIDNALLEPAAMKTVSTGAHGTAVSAAIAAETQTPDHPGAPGFGIAVTDSNPFTHQPQGEPTTCSA
jgi:pantoate--beta-alanine ligase